MLMLIKSDMKSNMRAQISQALSTTIPCLAFERTACNNKVLLQRVLNVQLCMAWSYLLLEIYQKPCAHITHQYLHHTHMVLVTIGNYRAFMQNPECMNRRMVRKYSRRVFIKWKGAKKAQSLVHTRLRSFFPPFANICLFFDMALAQRFDGCFGDLLYSGILIDLKYVGHTNKTKGH